MKKKVIIIVAAIIVVAVLVIFNLRSDRASKTEIQVTEVKKRNVSKVITASGNIRPKRRVNVSASAMGKVTEVAVEEGDNVQEGDFLLQIDATPYKSAVDQLSAAVRGAEAALAVEQATLKKARYDHERAQQLAKKEFVSENDLRDARVAVEIAEATVRSAEETLAQYQANLAKASHELEEVHITAEMSGVITALNVEEGESAIIGTINNPGTVLLTIADLSEMEAEVRVDETEVVYVDVGQKAAVNLDAYPDTTFSGVVTEVGNSAIRGQLGLGQESVDFKVIIAIVDSIPNIRPGLTASVDITVAESKDVIAIPIQCLTVRAESKIGEGEDRSEEKSGGGDEETETDVDDEKGDKEIEGVFVVEKGAARFRRIHVGIAGESHFHVESGLEEGEEVVSGPFKAISDLQDGDLVKVKKDKKKKSN